MDKLWKETFEKPCPKKAKSHERAFLDIQSPLDMHIAMRFHWYFSQITTFCQASDDPDEREGFINIFPPKLLQKLINKTINKLKQSILNKLERIERALDTAASRHDFRLGGEYLRQAREARGDKDHPLQSAVTFPRIFDAYDSSDSLVSKFSKPKESDGGGVGAHVMYAGAGGPGRASPAESEDKDAKPGGI